MYKNNWSLKKRHPITVNGIELSGEYRNEHKQKSEIVEMESKSILKLNSTLNFKAIIEGCDTVKAFYECKNGKINKVKRETEILKIAFEQTFRDPKENILSVDFAEDVIKENIAEGRAQYSTIAKGDLLKEPIWSAIQKFKGISKIIIVQNLTGAKKELSIIKRNASLRPEVFFAVEMNRRIPRETKEEIDQYILNEFSEYVLDKYNLGEIFYFVLKKKIYSPNRKERIWDFFAIEDENGKTEYVPLNMREIFQCRECHKKKPLSEMVLNSELYLRKHILSNLCEDCKDKANHKSKKSSKQQHYLNRRKEQLIYKEILHNDFEEFLKRLTK